MKKKLLILSASIGLLLACFPFTLYAEEDPESDLGVDPPYSSYGLDSYFYDNYDLLPYIQADGTQYLNTGISTDSDYVVEIKISDLSFVSGSNNNYLFGSLGNGDLAIAYNYVNDKVVFRFNSNWNEVTYLMDPYVVYNLKIDKTNGYVNNTPVAFYNTVDFANSNPMYIFAVHKADNSITGYSSFKLYNFSIYDSSEDEYVRYYYPAKAKSGGTIGLYDSVSKTFISSSAVSQFENPTDDQVIGFQISAFIEAGLDWIGDILDFAFEEPLIITFMAIGLAGSMFRWGRRLVHF